jgi:23S rRNA pseudouridine955/2504/2580 synthase
MHQISDLTMISKKAEETTTGVRHVQVDAGRDGQRIDNFLGYFLKGVPKSLIYRLLRTGQVRVNKGRIKPGHRVKTGDDVRIPPVRLEQRPELSGAHIDRLGEELAEAILFENKDFLVLNKPAGLAVHGGTGLGYGLIEALRAGNPRYAEVELVHRLDRETSGCLMLAKNRGLLRQLHALLQSHAVEKTYLALLKNPLPRPTIDVDSALARNHLQGGERMVTVADDGKAAHTSIERVRNYANAGLASIRIKTGRTHQIRVHCTSIGHPLAGDDKYGDRDFNREMKQFGLKRLFLHAAELRFTLEETHVVSAPLPAELNVVLENLNGDTAV